MAEIPDFTALGQRPQPTPAYRRPLVDQSGQIMAHGLEEAGASLQETGEQVYARTVNLARAQASNALLDHEISVKNTVDQIQQQVQAGKLPWDQAPQVYDDLTSKLETPNIAHLDPIGQQNLERGMKRNVLGGAMAVRQVAINGQKQAFTDQFIAAQDKLGKLAGMPGADVAGINSQLDAYRPMALAAGIPAPEVDRQIQEFKDQNWFNQATQRAITAKDSPQALRELQHDLSDADGFYVGKLGTAKRDELMRTVTNDQLILQNRAQHEADKREALAARTIGQIDEQISTGIPATPQMWQQWGTITKGTTFEQDFKQRLGDEAEVQKVLREPLDQQLAYVQGRQQQLEQQGGTLRDRANLMRLQTAVNQNVNLLQKAPLLFNATRNGTEVAPLNLQALSSGDPQDRAAFQQQIGDRMATLKAMRTQYGPTVAPLPLLPQEAKALADQFQNATPTQRVQQLVSLRGAMGDDAAFQSAMVQIAPHSPVTSIVGSMVGSSAPSATPTWWNPTYAPQLLDAERILRGEQLLNPASGGKAAQLQQESGKGATLKGGMPMPPDSDSVQNGPGLRSVFGKAAGDMFRDRPQLADAYYAVFKDAYAALLAEQGDMRGLPNHDIAQKALQIALGNRARFQGGTFSVPAGMDPSNFESNVRDAVQATAEQLKAPSDWQDRINGYGLKEIGGLGSGRYLLVNGNTPLVRPDGKGLFTIDLRDQFLGARGLHRGTPDFKNGGAQVYPDQVTFSK